MAIVTLDGVISGAQPVQTFTKAVTATLVAGLPNSLWLNAGNPAAGVAALTTTVGGAALSSSTTIPAGGIPHYDPAAGKKSYLAGLTAMIAGQAGILQLCDRLHQNATITAGTALLATGTAAQAIVNSALPARDQNGAVTGTGVLCGLEAQTTMGASTSTAETLVYVDTILGAGQSVTSYDTVASAAPKGTFYRFPLAAGGGGVAQTTSLAQQATMTSGQLALVLYRVLASINITATLVPAALDALTGGFPQLQNGVVPFFLFIPSTTTAVTLQGGTYTETQG